ncbi:50S ribosomal protein L9 [bacterium]|jgi:large subunit ribosomal protein L9|nr:50S ribosomal protein L9 [bacterium]MBT6293868.1 50S ribosomal protein L9 [bacterium]
MKVILMQDVPKLGIKYQMISVKPGFFRNFLLPRGFAQVATKKLLEKGREIEAMLTKKRDEEKANAVSIFNIINAKSLKVSMKLNSKGKLYSKVSKEIVIDQLKAQHDQNVAPDKLKFNQNIKETGSFDLIINLGHDQVAQMKINVEGIEE